MNTMTTIRWVAICGLLLSAGDLPAQSSGGSNEGRVTSLPTAGQPHPEQVTLGAARLLETSLKEEIAALRSGDLKRFVEAHRQVVDALVVLGDGLGDAAETLGTSEANLQLAERALPLAGEAVKATNSGADRSLLLGQLERKRSTLASEAKVLREQLAATAPEKKQRVLADLSRCVQRLQTLDHLRAAASGGNRIDPRTVGNLEQRLARAKQRAAEESEMLTVYALTIAEAVRTQQAEIETCQQLLRVVRHLPNETFDRLEAGQAQVRSAVIDFAEARRRQDRAFYEILDAEEPLPANLNEETLLQELDRLLKGTP